MAHPISVTQSPSQAATGLHWAGGSQVGPGNQRAGREPLRSLPRDAGSVHEPGLRPPSMCPASRWTSLPRLKFKDEMGKTATAEPRLGPGPWRQCCPRPTLTHCKARVFTGTALSPSARHPSLSSSFLFNNFFFLYFIFSPSPCIPLLSSCLFHPSSPCSHSDQGSPSPQIHFRWNINPHLPRFHDCTCK